MAEATMIETASIKKPANIANATFLFSNISFRRLWRGVKISNKINDTASIAMPKKEYKTELIIACDIYMNFICGYLVRCCSIAAGWKKKISFCR